MKTIIALLIMMVSFVAVSTAQSRSYTIPEGKSYIDVPLLATDTIGATQTTFSYVITAPQHVKQTQDIKISVDELTACNVTCKLQGAKFSGDTFTDIVSKVYYGGGSDTTFVLSNATANRYRIYKVLFTRNAGTAKILDVQLKLWFE